MDNQKKSFVLYLDNWPELELLDMEQRGMVLTAVFEFAARLSAGEQADFFGTMKTCPQLSEGGRMACGFLCATLERDHLKWLHRKQARQRREEAARSGPSPTGSTVQADLERSKRLLQQMKGE